MSPVSPASSIQRTVLSVDEHGLWIGKRARARPATSYILLTPVGGLRKGDESPMNVAAIAQNDMQWMLPLDLRRLRLMRTTVEHEEQFTEIWRRIDEALVSPVEGRGKFWFCASPVGAALPGHRQWVEYWKARPWLEVARLAAHLVLVAPCTASWIAGRGSRLQCGVQGTEILPTAYEKLQPVDQRIEIAHVAALDPLEEGWEPIGYVEAAALSRVRRAMHEWPQRAPNGRVVMEG